MMTAARLAAWRSRLARPVTDPAGPARYLCLVIAVALGFAAVAAQLALLASGGPPGTPAAATASAAPPRQRADIVDRNGIVLATDIPVYGLSADPQRIIDADDAAERLAPILGESDVAALRGRLAATAGRFVWLKRGLTPRMAAAVHDLGLPGLSLAPEPGRVYPAGALASQVLGLVDVDNIGVAGLEKRLDEAPDAVVPPADSGARATFATTLDARVQYAVQSELRDAMQRYRAKAAGAIVLDATTGEIVALASLPDADPNRRADAQRSEARNRLIADAYELGSVFKALTVAMALDGGIARLEDRFDIATPVRAGGRLIVDKHARGRDATVAEIFTRSSNTGAARIGLAVGAARQQEFLARLGLLDAVPTDAGATARPLLPQPWGTASVVTVSYGHGIAVAPLAFAAAVATLVNGGTRVPPRFTPGSAGPRAAVLRPATSAALRQLLAANVAAGTGRRAAVPGLDVGGKTGTALKPVAGRYSDAVMTSFVGAFPMAAPRFVVLALLDEPQPLPQEKNEAAYNAAPTAGAIIARIAPLLGLFPAPLATAFDNQSRAFVSSR